MTSLDYPTSEGQGIPWVSFFQNGKIVWTAPAVAWRQASAKAKSLGPAMTALAEWGLNHIPGTKAALKPTFE
jgi:hypothetical protein